MNNTCHKCGLVNDFRVIKKSSQDTCWCNGCNNFMGNLPQGKDPTIYFGKYKDRLISSMITSEEVKYLNWLIEQPFCKEKLVEQIKTHLKNLNNG